MADIAERAAPGADIAEDHEGGRAAAERYARYSALVQVFPEGEAPKLPRCKDRDDQKFLELAARCNANLLVSKDKALLCLRGRTTLGFQIVKPAAASALLAS